MRFEFDGGDPEVADLWTRLSAEGWKIISCREVIGDLEEAYLSITQQAVAGERAGG